MRLPIEENEMAVDIPEMAAMSEEEYSEYLESELLLIDSNWAVRSNCGGFPLAVDRKQLQIMIEYLQKIESRYDD
jgi:hypothetical protein